MLLASSMSPQSDRAAAVEPNGKVAASWVWFSMCGKNTLGYTVRFLHTPTMRKYGWLRSFSGNIHLLRVDAAKKMRGVLEMNSEQAHLKQQM